MKIFSREQIYQGDKITAEKQQISSTDLMERAGTKIFEWMHLRMQGAQVPIHIFCGIGNNGGDGLVIGRHLINHGYNVFIYIVNYSDKRSKDFLINYERIKNTTKKWPELLKGDDNLPEIQKDDIIIDAIFGIGLNRPPETWVINIFKHLRNSGAYTLSVDIPSGLSDDTIPSNEDAVVWADNTLSFQAPKLVFFLPDTAKYTVTWQILDIGIDSEFISETQTVAHLIGKVEVLRLYKPRQKFSHKGTYGHALLIGGSLGKMGAMILCVRAAVSAGAGLVSAYIPSSGNIILQTAVPEAMTLLDGHEHVITKIETEVHVTACGIGPGLGQSKETVQALEEFLKINKSPLVIDADAINIIAKNKSMLKSIPENSIFTPHPKELERLIGEWKDDFDKLDRAIKFTKRHKVIIVIKGAHTIVVTKDNLYINSTGNQGLAKGGSGDVLTGVITSLLAQGYTPLDSSIFGVYLHGKSADLLVERTGYQSMTASLVIDGLSQAYLDLFKTPETNQKKQDSNEEEE